MKDKIKNISELKQIVNEIKKTKKIATTNGSFDILHIGHVDILERAKQLTDVLIVLINSDVSIKKLKGSNRPVIPENERAKMLAALECVDYVTIFDEDKPLNYLREIKPNMHIKGGSFIPERIKEEKDLVESWGGEHITLPLVEGLSTTNIIEKIKSSN